MGEASQLMVAGVYGNVFSCQPKKQRKTNWNKGGYPCQRPILGAYFCQLSSAPDSLQALQTAPQARDCTFKCEPIGGISDSGPNGPSLWALFRTANLVQKGSKTVLMEKFAPQQR
jgi:hypothetical protein